MTARGILVLVLSAVPVYSQVGPLNVGSVQIQPHTVGELSPIELYADGRLTGKVSFRLWVYEAYGIPSTNLDFNQVEGAPEWLSKEYYDVEAMLPPTAFPPGVSIQTLRERLREVERNLLADRLKLQVHFEKREKSTYELRLAPGGVRLAVAMLEKDCPLPRPIDPNDARVTCHSFEGGRGRGMFARAATIEDLASFVEIWTDRIVVDRTGLTDLFGIDTSPWYGITSRPRATTSLQDGVDTRALPTLAEVLAYMGLEMVPAKNVVDVLVIDHVERPTTN